MPVSFVAAVATTGKIVPDVMPSFRALQDFVGGQLAFFQVLLGEGVLGLGGRLDKLLAELVEGDRRLLPPR